MIKHIGVALGLLVATGCTVRSDVVQLGPNRFVVTADGTQYASAMDVEKHCLRVAANKTLQNGDDYFIVVDWSAGTQEHAYTVPGYVNTDSRYSDSGSGWVYGNYDDNSFDAWGNWGSSGAASHRTTYAPATTQYNYTHHAQLIIETYQGQAPDGDRRAFDAYLLLTSNGWSLPKDVAERESEPNGLP